MGAGKNPVIKKHPSRPDSLPHTIKKKVSLFKQRHTIKKKEKRKKNPNPKPANVSAEAATKAIVRSGAQWRTSQDQAQWLTDTFHSAYGSFLSQLERDPIPEDSLVHLSEERDHDIKSLSWHCKRMIGESWKDVLCKGEHGTTREKGSPALLILCSSAIRCVELLKGLRKLTKECKPAKLFAKHIKVEEQVGALEGHVNIAAGTPNRVKKLVDIGALGLGRLSIVLLDMHQDAKGLTLFTVPQVKIEFWELYRDHFHHRVLDRRLQICLY